MPTPQFDPALPTARDRMRLLLGDTGALGYWIFQDETIEAELGRAASWSDAAVFLAQAAITRVAQEPDLQDAEGRLKSEWRHRIQAWEKLIGNLRGGIVPAAEPEAGYPVTVQPLPPAPAHAPPRYGAPGFRF